MKPGISLHFQHDLPTIARYRLTTCLGGQGTLAYRADHVDTHEPYVLVLFARPALEPEAWHRFRDRFFAQTQALQALPRHPGLLPLVDAGVEKGFPFLVFPALAEAHPIYSPGMSPLSVQETLTIVQAVAEALAHVHEHHLVHGMLTPASLLQPPVAAQTPVVVAGAGLRNMVEVQGLRQEDPPYAHLRSVWNTFLGEPSLLAPECVLGHAPDPQSDIHALGLIGATLLTGQDLQRHPRREDYLAIALQSLRQPGVMLPKTLEIESEVRQVLSRLLAYHRQHRFQSMQEVAEACHVLLGSSAPSSNSASPG